ncbi:MAG: serine/threonine-protein kinase PknH/PknJ [Actinomycetota bacterium]|uniref:non-specific serine/threonine protein kinase n=1 Tax=Mycobacterium lentiflavum TaxID=141349 RepID=A0ABY3UQA2_MYCLN|nr:serine/threonine-protein kinase PknH/PknJ [Mycobacterium lentiflavum]MEE3064011.1 serine/threonine-protein kinase PknH/PknJ [Actinomycetota bacterium]ULP40793.1 serine/threonine-protein kinase PknH/PknJ [Mycobacterium lentiflavum]
MLANGSLVCGYRIQAVLGSGGMGTVYLAADPALPRHVALKVLSAELSRDRDFRARFIREADTAAALAHPQIVSVYTRGQTDEGQLWIAMQFVDGTDAEAALCDGTMTPQRAVHIITQVARALDFAHANHVIHRDVKPGNFMLSGPVGPNERVLLGDFGIARALDDVGLTATGAVVATIGYAAPEVLSNGRIDGRVDIYSLGCTLYRLLTGNTPFAATNGAAAVMMAHLFQPPPRVTDAVPSLPPALDHVIAVAMAKDPAARFPTASALADAAVSALHERNRYAPLPSIPSGAVRSYPHTSQPPTVSAWRGSPTPGPFPPAGPAKRRRALIAAALAGVVLLGATVAMLVWPDAAGPSAGSRPGSGSPGAPASPQGPPATNVAPAQLRAILLSAAQLPVAANGDPLVLEQDSASLLDDSAAVDNQQCLGAWAPAQQNVDGQKGYTGVAVQTLRGMNEQAWQDSVTQAVIAFQRDNAVSALTSQEGQWSLCGGKSITVTEPGTPAKTWDFGQPQTTAGVLTLAATLRGGGSCDHGMMVRGNVLVDIRQCSAAGGADIAALVSATANKVPRQ